MPHKHHKSILLIIILAISFYCLDYYFRIVPGLVLPELMRQYHSGPAVIGGFYSAFYLGYSIMQVPSGILLDNFSPKKIIMLMIFLCTTLFIVFVWSTQIWLGLILRFLVGSFSAFSFISVLHVARSYFSERYFGLISGLTIGAGTTVAAMIQAFAAYFSELNNWHWVLTIQASFGFLMLLALFFVKPIKNEKSKLSENKNIVKQVLYILKNKSLVLNALLGAFLYLPTSIFAAAWGVTFLRVQYSLSSSLASVAILCLFGGWALGSPLMGAFAGERKTYPRLLFYCSILLALLSCFFLYFPSVLGKNIFVALILFGVLSSSQVLTWRIFAEICPANLTGLGASITNTIITLVITIFHPIAGYLISIDSTAGLNLKLGLALLPIVFFVTAVASLFLWRNIIKL